MSEWIRVEDKSPDPWTTCLTWDGRRVREDLFITKRFHRDTHGLGTTTHWMPIPAPPK